MNLAEALLASAVDAPDRPALRGPDLSYGKLAARARAAAVRLDTVGEPGDRVAIVAGNEPAFVVAYLGALLRGMVAVPLNVSSPAHELAREIAAVSPVAVIASPGTADLARRALGELDEQAELLVLDENDERTEPYTPVPREPSDLAVLLFTAGTAGAPKPAMLTHGSLLANIEQMQSHPGLRLFPDDVALGVLPLFHVYGLNVSVGLTMRAGGSVALVDHFHPAETLARIQSDGVTVVAAVPVIYAAWLALDASAAPKDAFARVRLCVSGAATLPPEIASAMRERFGIAVHDGYGLTEASPVVTTTAVATEPRAGSIGPPLPGIEIRLVDADGHPVLEHDPGEILVRGANVFAGYWNDPDATNAVLVDGWLRTGDIAIADDDGWLRLVERAKDVIIVSGFNVYPGEVEDALRSHPDVDDAAVVGELHPRTGETVVAFVVAASGSTPDPIELLRHAGRRLARYKLPTRVEVVDALPRTVAGKLVRRALPGSERRTPDATAKPE
jgi:long-chain acyl-CoA synthetase